jgi:hypothetical protein
MNMPNMKASELRIGNYVYFHGDVEEINIDHFNIFNIIKDDVLLPIPLTEEWLLKFDFHEYIDFGYKIGHFDKVPLCGFTYSINTNKVMIMHKGNNNSHWLDIEIKYVHQLQNLYFALTGEELILNI